MRTSPSGARTASTMRCQRDRSGSRVERQAEMAQHFAVHALLVIADRHRVDRVRHPAPAITASGRTLQNSAILRRSLSGIGRSQRHSSICGWMPTFSSSFTECCVGLVFSSPAEGMYGTSVRCTNIARSGPSSLPSWRIASRNGRLSMSPTVPPISTSTKSRSSVSRSDDVLDRVGDVRDHLHGGAEIVAAPLLGDHLGIDAPGGGVVGAAWRARR